MRRILYLIVSVLVGGQFAALAPSAGADEGLRPAEPAGKYMARIVREKVDSDYAAAWRTLYPPHQQIATLDAYVACESLVPGLGARVNVRVLRTYNDRIQIAGEKRTTVARAVRIRVAVAWPGFHSPVVVTQVFHAVPVDHQWRWILSVEQYAAYSAGTCPYA